MDSFLQDLRFAYRSLKRNSAFTAAAIATLALGIGVNAAMFSVVNAALFRPLPYRDPARLMTVSLVMPADPRRPGTSDMVWSFPKYEAFRQRQAVFSAVALSVLTAANLSDESASQRLNGEMVTASYFETLGIRPTRGRTFAADDDSIPEARFVIVLGARLWEQHFGGDTTIVGRSITLDGRPYTVIGVAGRDFRGLSGAADFWVPVHTQSAAQLSHPWNHSYTMVARLPAGVSNDQAIAAMPILGRSIDALYPNPHGPGEQSLPWSARARSMNDMRINAQLRRVLLVLWAAVGCILLIAAANVANMQLARSSARGREIALRFALGASRVRVMRQLLTETMVLTVAGTIAGLMTGSALLQLLFAAQTNAAGQIALRSAGLSATLLSELHLDLTVTVVTVAVALLVGVLFGLAPAAHSSRADLAGTFRGDVATPTGAALGRLSGRDILVVAEVAMAFTLVVAAVVLGRSVERVLSIDPGFNPKNVLTARVALPAASFNVDSTPLFYDELVRRIAALPGVTSASLTDCPPLSGGCSATFPSYVDRAAPPGFQMPLVGLHWATPGYFQTLGVPLLSGRPFNDLDRAGRPRVIIVNRSMANELWPGEDPIGKRLKVGQGDSNAGSAGSEVVGVVGDTRFGAIDSLPRPDAFIPFAQSPQRRVVLMVRSVLTPSSLVHTVRETVTKVAGQLPVFDVRTMEERIGASAARPRFGAQMLTLFGALALALSVVGIYGVLAFIVARRTREIGIRIALGAEVPLVMRSVLGHGMMLVLVGVTLGAALAAAGTRVLSSLLFEAPPVDFVAYAAATVVFLLTAGAACWIPARRAAAVDPVIAFRAE